MTVVADSSPRVILAKLRCFDLLPRLIPVLHISSEVHHEVVIAGAGLPGAAEVASAQWIVVTDLQDPSSLHAARERSALGAGELSTILLAKELRADSVLLDDHKARRFATAEGLHVRGSIGLLEAFHQAGHLTDLRAAFRGLLDHHVYVNPRLLDLRLKALALPPL